MSLQGTEQLIFELGVLSVWQVTPTKRSIFDIFAPHKYYWKCNLLKKTYGYFNTVFDAVKHYEATLKAERQAFLAAGKPTQPPVIVKETKENLVTVDFTKKPNKPK